MAMNILQHGQFPLRGVVNNLNPVNEREWTGQMPDLGGVNPINNPMPEQFPMGTPAGISPNGQFPARPNVDMNNKSPLQRGDFPVEHGNGQNPGIFNPGNIQINHPANQFPVEMPINMIPNGQTAPGTAGNSMINPIDRANTPGNFIPSRRRPRPVKFNQIKNQMHEMHEMTNAITPPVIQLSPENNFQANSLPTSNMINPQFPIFQPERIQPAGMHLPNNEILPNIHEPEHKHKMRVLPMWNRPGDRSHMQPAMNPNTNSLFPAHTPGSNPIIRENQNQPLPRRTGVSPGEWLRSGGNNLIPDVPQPDQGIITPSEQLSSGWPTHGGNIGVPFHPDYLNPISHTNGNWKRMWKKKGGY
ncbi:mediator of RNA polymerase II transcription subunit 15-like [Mytilus trossulus]|uniref:mediator of RNA polymerase II transcription subunit 15-like n=1 Tax=Mytilus trossulus TaxID=6551 RepID=UPI003007CEDB